MKKEMIDKYNKWNIQKKNLASKEVRFFFKTGEVWWCSLGMNLGSESFGKGECFQRPVLIIKKLSGNTCIGLPLTSQEKIGTWFADINFQEEKSWVMLYQVRMLHTNRFQRRIGTLQQGEFEQVKEKLKILLELS